jgi:pseudomonalisin
MNWNGVCRSVACLAFALLLSALSFAQTGAAARIQGTVNDSDVALLPGGVHPHVARALDQGSVSPSMPMQRMAIFFKPTDAQQANLDQLLQQQQDPGSPNYRKWLTPEQFGARFGMSTSDLAKVTVWLQSHGFRNVTVSRSRNSIEFDGNAGQASAAFRTPIHQVQYNGETHYANIASPRLPSAFAGAVAGITSLNNFRPRAMSVAHLTSNISGNHFLVPGDVGTIYNINSLYNSGLDGTGEAIAVVGQTTLTKADDGTHADIDRFRSLSGLPAINLQQIKTGSPTYSSSDVDEANLDIEWSGAIAPKAQIIFVYSDNALFSSLPYIVTNNLAPVISISYGNCEANFDASSVTVLTQTLTQANTQGQTITTASGDNGAADCDGTMPPVTKGLAVDVPSSTPYVTGMGGTEFSADSTATFTCNPTGSTNCVAASDPPYWNGSSSLTDTSATALEYIPEEVWNDTDSTGIAAGGGGVSTLFTKPTWQTGAGVPADGQRDVPDISLSSSPNHDGYIFCSQGGCANGYRTGTCSAPTDPGCVFDVIGGTSVASPVFSGVVALMNQKLGTRLGNVNSMLYSLAASAPNVFHDITTGNNMVPCQAGSKDCGSSGMIGYNAAAGYDLASGLGSVDMGALAAAWAGTTPGDFSVAASPSSLTITHGTSATSSIAVTASGGFAGTVTLSCTVTSSLGASTCSLTPTSVGAGQTSTLTISATSTAALRSLPLPGHHGSTGFGFGLAAVCFIPWGGGSRARRRLLRQLSLSLLGLALVVGLVACGGGGSSNNNNNNNFTPLSGTVTVQAVSGSLTHSVSIPVTIN